MSRALATIYLLTGMCIGMVLLWTCSSGQPGQPGDAAGLPGVRDAAAQSSESVARVITADTDMSALVTGTVTSWDEAAGSHQYATLADGPLVLTDINGYYDFTAFIAERCGPPEEGGGGSPRSWGARMLGGNDGKLEGARYPVREGEKLCLHGYDSVEVTWAGFRPYN